MDEGPGLPNTLQKVSGRTGCPEPGLGMQGQAQRSLEKEAGPGGGRQGTALQSQVTGGKGKVKAPSLAA